MMKAHPGTGPRPAGRIGTVIALALLLNGTSRAADSPRIPDIMLTDETGRQVRVYEDLVKDRVVAMNFIFTACTTICQPMSATFSKVQALIGSRPVRLVSISLDPGTDTSQRLAEWKARFHGGPSWTLLTGSLTEIDRLRKALGVYTPDRFNHSPTIVLIDDNRGRLTRISGLASARSIVEAIDGLSSGAPERTP
jgi:protein SCO1/2